ncbi:MAG: hypothetical protein II289_09600, partial [Bacteroidales bacterium]|nr:hypothetical protein [Bacteroidales bacterium]
FMDNRSKFPHSSMKMPHFMDNLINSVPLSTKSPIFMDNRSEFHHSSMKLDIERKHNLVNLIKRQ